MAEQGSDVIRGHDDVNTTSLMIVPTQERLPDDMLRLERKVIRPNGQPATIECVGVPGVGITRGSDNDFLVSLINLYIDQGCPSDGIVMTSAYALLQMAGLATTGQYYRQLSQGLERMMTTTFHIRDGWFNVAEKRYLTVSFRIIDNLSRTHVIEGGQARLDRKSMLRIRLNDEITKSIKAGYIRPLDLEMYRSLPSVGSRALYRMLDIYLEEGKLKSKMDPYSFSISMMTVAANCGLINKRTDHVRKSLESMHDALIKFGFLDNVDYIGRGLKTHIRYTFASENGESVLLKMLLSKGTDISVAKRAVATWGNDVKLLVAAHERAARNNSQGLRTPGGYMGWLIKNAPDQIEKERMLQAEETQSSTNLLVIQTTKSPKVAISQDQLDHEYDSRIMAMSPENAADYIISSFITRNLMGAGMDLRHIESLRELIIQDKKERLKISKLISRYIASRSEEDFKTILELIQ